MINDYVKLLSNGNAVLLSKTGEGNSVPLIVGEKISVIINGSGTNINFLAAELTAGGNCFMVDHTKEVIRAVHRLIIEQFLKNCPTLRPMERMYQLAVLLERTKYSSLDASGIARHIRNKINLALSYSRPSDKRRFGGEQWVRYSYTARKDEFTDRQRHYKRMMSRTNTTVRSKLHGLVSSYNINIANLSVDLYLRDCYGGYTYNWNTKCIDVYSKHNETKRKIDLSSVNIYDDKFVAVYGVRNVFCAHIEEATDSTICLRLLNKNLNFYGYVCAPIEKVRWHDDCTTTLSIELPVNHLQPSANKAVAYAKLLAM